MEFVWLTPPRPYSPRSPRPKEKPCQFVRVLLVGVLLFTLAATTALGEKDLPLRIENKTYLPAEQSLEYTIRNASRHTITAWGVRIVAAGAAGGTMVLTEIEDHAFPDPVQPGQTRSIRYPIALDGDPQLLALTLEPLFVIFEDRSALGDRDLIDTLFANRAGYFGAVENLLKILGESPGLAEAEERLPRRLTTAASDAERELDELFELHQEEQSRDIRLRLDRANASFYNLASYARETEEALERGVDANVVAESLRVQLLQTKADLLPHVREEDRR